MKLDQFYTKPRISKTCYNFFLSKIKLLNLNFNEIDFIEPSAGTGSFFNIIETRNKIGLDIQPRTRNIKKQDFLKWDFKPKDKSNVVIIGNPPFGRRSKLAIEFFNKSTEFAETIAFIVPLQFRKYSVHSKLKTDYKLVAEKSLPSKSFFTSENKDFGVNCVFQIWTRKNTNLENKRILTPPPISHPDFELHQYNNTKQALKVFGYSFDFAVPRQGYENYSRKERHPDKMEKNKQWILFKANNKEARQRLERLNFEKLAQKNTVIPGFGKADVVEEYIMKYAYNF